MNCDFTPASFISKAKNNYKTAIAASAIAMSPVVVPAHAQTVNELSSSDYVTYLAPQLMNTTTVRMKTNVPSNIAELMLHYQNMSAEEKREITNITAKRTTEDLNDMTIRTAEYVKQCAEDLNLEENCKPPLNDPLNVTEAYERAQKDLVRIQELREDIHMVKDMITENDLKQLLDYDAGAVDMLALDIFGKSYEEFNEEYEATLDKSMYYPEDVTDEDVAILAKGMKFIDASMDLVEEKFEDAVIEGDSIYLSEYDLASTAIESAKNLESTEDAVSSFFSSGIVRKNFLNALSESYDKATSIDEVNANKTPAPRKVRRGGTIVIESINPKTGEAVYHSLSGAKLPE